MITDISQLDPNGTYTYADYLKWQFDESVELLKGKLSKMSPAPRAKHQKAVSHILRDLFIFFSEQTCEIYPAPFDVRLPNPDRDGGPYEPGFNDKVHTVVQPDICVICDESKVDEFGCVGPPDWIIEIASPSTQKKDFNEKFDLYEAAGVPEYWIAIPKSQEIYVFALEDGRYEQKAVYEQGQTAASVRYPALTMSLDWIFG